jgi:hypothetical protein
MSVSRPHRLATWLLHRLVSDPKLESLSGDLAEQYQRKHSNNWWYWRQVFTAVLTGAARDICDHKLLAIRGVFAGWAFLVLFYQFILRVSALDRWLFVTGLADVHPHGRTPCS